MRCFDERSRMSAARVLAFLDTGILSGPARQLIAAIPLLRERGYDVRPVVYQSGEARTDFRRALEAADIDYSVLHYGTRRDLLSGKLVEELIRKEGPRIIQTHNFRPAVGCPCHGARLVTFRGWRFITATRSKTGKFESTTALSVSCCSARTCWSLLRNVNVADSLSRVDSKRSPTRCCHQLAKGLHGGRQRQERGQFCSWLHWPTQP